MAINIVNISELTATVSKSGNMLFAVEVGGQLRKLTKSQLLSMLGTPINTQTAIGPNNLWTFDTSNYKIFYLNDGLTNGKLFFQMDRVYFTPDGNAGKGVFINTSGAITIVGDSGDAVLAMTKDGYLFNMTIDPALTSGAAGHLGTSLDQQLVYNAALPNATAQLSKRCQRSILKVATTTNAVNDIYFPQTPKDGYTFELVIKGTITTLNLIADGSNTIEDAPTTATDQSFKFVYNLDNEIWLRIF